MPTRRHTTRPRSLSRTATCRALKRPRVAEAHTYTAIRDSEVRSKGEGDEGGKSFGCVVDEEGDVPDMRQHGTALGPSPS